MLDGSAEESEDLEQLALQPREKALQAFEFVQAEEDAPGAGPFVEALDPPAARLEGRASWETGKVELPVPPDLLTGSALQGGEEGTGRIDWVILEIEKNTDCVWKHKGKHL